MAISGGHGGEGFCGSGALVGWLRSGRYRDLPPSVRVVLVHAINPFGFAAVRRVNEDNVDLNRNFIDFSQPLPTNPEYDALHPHVVPEKWTDETQAAQKQAFDAYIAENGQFALQKALSRGQYAHSDGIFFGGWSPTWSNKTFRKIVQDHVRGAEKVAFVDFHTGLGPYGTCDMMTNGVPGDSDYDRAVAWYGEGISSPAAGNSTSAPLTGVIDDGLAEEVAGSELTSITAEFGTFPVLYVLNALLGDNWLHLKGDPGSPMGREMKAHMRNTFGPPERDWQEMISLRSFQLLRRAVKGLST